MCKSLLQALNPQPLAALHSVWLPFEVLPHLWQAQVAPACFQRFCLWDSTPWALGMYSWLVYLVLLC